jgi:hypothetical protein
MNPCNFGTCRRKHASASQLLPKNLGWANLHVAADASPKKHQPIHGAYEAARKVATVSCKHRSATRHNTKNQTAPQPPHPCAVYHCCFVDVLLGCCSQPAHLQPHQLSNLLDQHRQTLLSSAAVSVQLPSIPLLTLLIPLDNLLLQLFASMLYSS